MTNTGFLKKAALRGLLCAFVFVGAATGIGALFRLWQFPETNIVVVYILSVVVTARCTDGYLWGMGEFPNAPEPHNLLGIVMEKEGDHAGAMRHFRAAYALDPTCLPARQNLDHYGTFYSRGGCAYDESDCPQEAPSSYEIQYDEKGIGHAVRRNTK